MKVCIAEKPSVAREIASVLGATTKRDGYFEGNGYAVTYTFGHLCTLKEPSDYKPYWKSWDLNNLPMLPEKFEVKVSDNQGIKKQFSIVKSLFDKAEVVINCGDAGQEGELIQRWVLNEANYKGDVKRLWISSLTTEAIKEGFKNLKPASDYDNLYYAGFSRSIGDWLLGINATRLYTVKHGGYKQVLSVGRVQTPTLAMLVNRWKTIENFKPQPYWELQTIYRDTVFNYEDGRFLKMEDGEVLANKVKEHDFEVVSVTKKKGKEYAPKLFDLTGLQVYCNTKFGLSADETLKIAQRLYEQKAISYPRVDTTFLPNDVYPKVKSILSKLSSYATLTTPLLAQKIKKSSKVFNDKKVTDHHAIIPTGIEIHMQHNEQRVYDAIVRRFIAVFYNDCEVSNTVVIGKAAEVKFRTTGKEILSKGWRVVFESEKSTKNEDSILPTFVEGEKGKHQPSFIEKQTKPPNQFTEASLLRAMETAGKQVDDDELRDIMKENGIGRPSTRANIIETLFRRKYIKRNKKQLIPTVTGIQLIDTIKNELLKSAELTGSWEKQLKDIEKGEFSASAFIKGMKRMVDALVYEVRSENVQTRISAVNNKPSGKPKAKSKANTVNLIGASCPKCKSGQLIKGKSAYGCTLYGKSCDFTLPFNFGGKKVSENQFLRLLSKGSTVNLKGFKIEGNTIEGLLRFDDHFKLKLEPKKAKSTPVNAGDICPKCKTGQVLKGNTAFGCSNYKVGCDYRVSF
ncbi:type IA DNA topoisomerase [Winogradskyella immobilis]|uniref:DNA topoisomerase n=1 Tax=Winogradskyella immobilis TaxID=2816852 RepID=A0ABS8EQR4_9FLAO|nr:type IA DNA topoisomerase [Winogradskyella immobilis]MCC1484647.1 DNA topoisomerase 3 [Winogradskyella immobilis]MCG0016739.1 DNA topoisomerase 3 [Winogradskyella immobilis]